MARVKKQIIHRERRSDSRYRYYLFVPLKVTKLQNYTTYLYYTSYTPLFRKYLSHALSDFAPLSFAFPILPRSFSLFLTHPYFYPNSNPNDFHFRLHIFYLFTHFTHFSLFILAIHPFHPHLSTSNFLLSSRPSFPFLLHLSHPALSSPFLSQNFCDSFLPAPSSSLCPRSTLLP